MTTPNFPVIRTLGDICDIIADNLDSLNPELAKHAETLLGPRKRGSTTERALSFLPKTTPVEWFIPHCVPSDCRAYHFQSERLRGKMGAMTLQYLEKLGYIKFIEEREGEHGLELYLNHPDADKLAGLPVNYSTAILGHHDTELAVFTWHPGPPMAFYKGGWEANPDDINPHTGVKLA